MKRLNNLGLGRDIDKLNDRLSRLWPEESGNGNGNDHDNNNIIKNSILDAAERWWYQEYKEQWLFHKSSYYMRGLNAYDGQGCNSAGCILECQFYAAEGKLPLPPSFSYEKFVSEPHLYPSFQNFLNKWIRKE